MFKLFRQWICSKRVENQHPYHLSSVTGGEIYDRLEKTGIHHKRRRRELLRDPVTGFYWLSEHQEQGFGQWETYSSMDQQTGEAILRYPDMLSHYYSTGDWVIPNTNSTEHPACLSTEGIGSVGAELLERLESVGVADHANGLQILKDIQSNQYWLAKRTKNDSNEWQVLISLDESTTQKILKYPTMLAIYSESGEWVQPYDH